MNPHTHLYLQTGTKQEHHAYYYIKILLINKFIGL